VCFAGSVRSSSSGAHHGSNRAAPINLPTPHHAHETATRICTRALVT